jgi:hypothetical protein
VVRAERILENTGMGIDFTNYKKKPNPSLLSKEEQREKGKKQKS